MKDLKIENLDHLGIVAGMVDELESSKQSMKDYEKISVKKLPVE